MQTQVVTAADLTPLAGLQRNALIAAVGGAIVGVIGVVLQPGQLMPSWLIGFIFCLSLSLGCLALLMTQHMSGGQWGLVTRRIFEAGSRLLPFCLLLFIPIAVFAAHLYPWARPDVVHGDAILEFKHRLWLNMPLFLLRAAIYFVVWIGCAWLLNGWSAAQDRGEVALTEPDTRRFRVVSAPGILLYVVLLTLASVDWMMSLEPHWYSTIYGFIQVAGQGMLGLSFAVMVLSLLSKKEPMVSVLRVSHFHDLGKLMLAFVMLWAYFSFSQFLIIWAGNLPEEITYFLARLQNGWQVVSFIIVAGHFALPFCLLLSADLKKQPKLLARVAWFIIAIRLVDMIWLVAPVFNQGGIPISLANVGIPVALGGVWMYLFVWQLGTRPLLPVNDPYFKEMLVKNAEGGH